MANIKSYTDFEQSKRLAGILPSDSADMYYNLGESNIPNFIYGSHSDFRCYLPCWSLAALLGVLPITIPFNDIESCNLEIMKAVNGKWHIKYVGKLPTDIILFSRGNPVDICYEAIIKLHKLNLL